MTKQRSPVLTYGAAIVWAALSAICAQPSRSLADLDEPVEGDAKLITVVRDAQNANLASVPKGEYKATFAVRKLSGRLLAEGNIHLVWVGDKAFWEYEKRTFSDDKPPTPLSRVWMVYDRKEYAIHHPNWGEKGRIVVFGESTFPNRVSMGDCIDLRPRTWWSRAEIAARNYTWEHLVGPHAVQRPAPIGKWTVTSREPDTVLISAHIKPRPQKPDASSEIEVSLGLGGNVTRFVAYRGGNKQIENVYDWRLDERNRAILWGTTYTHFPSGSVVEIKVTEFNPHPTLNAKEFTWELLHTRSGVEVDDQVRGRKYTYGEKPVTQGVLDDLGDTIKQKRRP